MTRAAARHIALLYLAGLLQGCAFVLIPALGTTLAARPYAFTASAYALLFLPQTLGAIAGAGAAGAIQHRLGTGRLLQLGLLANGLAMLVLLAAALCGGSLSYALLLGEGLLLGLGFGWTVACINQYSAQFFGAAAGTAITLLNALIGAATAVSPLLLHLALRLGAWSLWPLLLAAGFLAAALTRLPDAPSARQAAFWPTGLAPYLLLVLVYAICEGSLGSWASVFVGVHGGLGNAAGALALSAYWASMTMARVGIALLPGHVVSRRVLLCASALGIAVCFAALGSLTGLYRLVGAFAFAGAACSVYYPFVMSLSLARFPGQGTQVAGLLVAALMVGEGIGSYGLGLLQPALPLEQIFLLSSAWGLPLVAGAWLITRQAGER